MLRVELIVACLAQAERQIRGLVCGGRLWSCRGTQPGYEARTVTAQPARFKGVVVVSAQSLVGQTAVDFLVVLACLSRSIPLSLLLMLVGGMIASEVPARAHRHWIWDMGLGRQGASAMRADVRGKKNLYLSWWAKQEVAVSGVRTASISSLRSNNDSEEALGAFFGSSR